MSRVGKKPLEIPKNVKIAQNQGVLQVEGPKGKLQLILNRRVKATVKENVLVVDPMTEEKTDQALQGTTRSLISNMVKGVTEGYTRELLIEGVGFKAALQGKVLNLSVGFTHPVTFNVPEGLTVKAVKPTQLLIEGIDKALVGQFAATIRRVYEAEPYKGKGIRFKDEVIRRKAGKAVTK